MIRDLESRSPVIEVLKFSPDGRYLAAAGCDRTLVLYGQPETICDNPRAWLVDTTTGKLLFEMKGYTSNLTSMVFSPDGTKLFTSVIFSRNAGKGDYSIHIYDVPTGTVIATLDPPIQTSSSYMFYLDISPDGRYLVTDALKRGDYASFVEWWDVQDPAQPRQVATLHYSYPHSLSPDSSQIIVQNPQDKSLHRYNLDSGALIGAILPPKQVGLHGFDYMSRFQYVSDSSTLLLDYGSELDIISLDSGEMIKSIPVDYVARYLFSPDRRLLLTSGYKFNGQGMDVAKSFSVWDTSTWQEVPKTAYMLDDFSYAYLLAFNADQTRLFVISDFITSNRIVTWGFPAAAQKDAEKTLLQFFDLLANGSYAQAVALTRWDQKDFADFLRKNIPGLFSGADLTAGLEKMCTDPAFPCRPVRDVLYRSEVAPGQYMFMVDFSAPDGGVEPWPSCSNNPPMCLYSNSMFRYVVVQRSDGSLVVSDGLPPALILHMK
jgi:DNA-binding beta-propeller fold protein YncE